MENKFIDSILLHRERVKNFFQKHYKILIPILKLIGGIFVFIILNSLYSYSNTWSSIGCLLFMSLLFSMIPMKYNYILTSVYILLQLLDVSVDVAVLYVGFLLIAYCLILRLLPGYSWIMFVVPVAFYLHIPCVVPILMGMFCGLSSGVVMILGVITYFFASYVREVVILLNSASQKETVVAFRKIIQLMSQDTQLFVTIVIVCCVFFVTYTLYRQQSNYAWYLAIVFGGITYLILRLMQALLFESDVRITEIIAGTALSLVLACVVQFFRCVIDYSRAEKIQFEDDEYYYYVEIVPKIMVQEKSKNVKKISTNSKKRKSRSRKSE